MQIDFQYIPEKGYKTIQIQGMLTHEYLWLFESLQLLLQNRILEEDVTVFDLEKYFDLIKAMSPVAKEAFEDYKALKALEKQDNIKTAIN